MFIDFVGTEELMRTVEVRIDNYILFLECYKVKERRKLGQGGFFFLKTGRS